MGFIHRLYNIFTPFTIDITYIPAITNISAPMIIIIDNHKFGLSPVIPLYIKNIAAIYVNAHTGQKWLATMIFNISNNTAQPRATSPIVKVVVSSISILHFLFY